MQMLAWPTVAMISTCPWPMSRRADAIAASSARVMVFVAPSGTRASGADGVTNSPCCIINSSINNIDPVITDLLMASSFWHGLARVCCMVAMSPQDGQYHILGFLYPSQSSWYCWSHVILWLLRLLPAWPRPGSDPVARNCQITQGNSQLCVARVSCIVRVIAFLVAH